MFEHLDDPNSPTPGPDRRRHVHDEISSRQRRRTRLLTAAAVAAVLVLGASAAALGWESDNDQQVSTATTDSISTITVPETTAATPLPSTSTTTSTTIAAATATEALTPFLTEAAKVDRALASAAERIDGTATSTEITYDQQTVDLLASAAPPAAVATLPAGMPDQLERAALLVYSELVSRTAALCDFGVGTFPRSQFDDRGCFTGGGPAAARFAADLATVTRLASTTPAFTVAPAASPLAEELAAKVQFIHGSNLGCAGVGGYIATEPIALDWHTEVDPQSAVTGRPPWQGTVGTIQFRGTYDPATGWSIELNAC